MKKIKDSELLKRADRGDPQKDIAASFGVSEAAISQRLKKLRKQAATAAALIGLTDKQQVFVAEICSGTGQTASALAAFDCLPDSAKSIGNVLMKDSSIRRAIDIIMEENGLSRSHLIKTLKRHTDGEDNQCSLRATIEGLKLTDSYPTPRNLNMNLNAVVSPVDLSRY